RPAPALGVAQLHPGHQGQVRRRALERDGEVFDRHWDRWSEQVEAHLERERTRERADVVVDTAGPEPVLCG
ncbi:MAG: hypothetical protein ACKOTA_03585, partial [Solirubrobacterales bacterium]